MSEVIKQRPGIRSTEFWLTLLSIVVGGLVSSDLLAESSTAAKVVALAGSVLGALGYTVSRSLVKIKTVRHD
tara:strand:- start:19013 stop:19228 length:216 start_codon:yes stop_codon:yes gene_type:complete